MVNGMVADIVGDKEVDKVADMVGGHGCWLIGPKLFRPEPYPPTSVSSKLCEFIFCVDISFFCVDICCWDFSCWSGVKALSFDSLQIIHLSLKPMIFQNKTLDDDYNFTKSHWLYLPEKLGCNKNLPDVSFQTET